MRSIHKLIALLVIPVFFAASPAFAQQSRVVDGAALTHALAAQAEGDRAQRDQVRRVLDRDDVRQMAATMGLNAAQASSAVATLGGADLATAAQHAGAIEQALAGGTNTIVISVTTLLLIIIIVILLAS